MTKTEVTMGLKCAPLIGPAVYIIIGNKTCMATRFANCCHLPTLLDLTSSTCQASADCASQLHPQSFVAHEQTNYHGVHISRCVKTARCIVALTMCAAMMRPIVKAASFPAYVLAIATAPHDMKLKTACHHLHFSILKC